MKIPPQSIVIGLGRAAQVFAEVPLLDPGIGQVFRSAGRVIEAAGNLFLHLDEEKAIAALEGIRDMPPRKVTRESVKKRAQEILDKKAGTEED